MTRIVSNWRINTKNTKLEHIDQFQPGDIFFVPGMVPPLTLKHWIQVYGTPDFIVCDHAGEVNIDGLKIYSAPLRGLAFSFEKFENFNQADLPREVNTKFCFNFFINNSMGRTNRHVLLKLVEYFKLECFDYILNDTAKYHDMQYVINELNVIANDEFSADFKTKLLAPTTLVTKYNKNFSHDPFDELASFKSHIWKDDVELVFNNSAVSLVSEFWYGWQLASVFSEKTILAIMGLTFPIFVGGYGHANCLKQAGLDVFDDVIDHSYQYRTTLIEQCFYAFKDNLHILTDLELAKQLRQTHLNRLLKNRDLLYEHILTKHAYSVVDTWPEPLRSSISSYWYFIQNVQVGKVMRQHNYFD